jgi:circadian clock protein KaiC
MNGETGGATVWLPTGVPNLDRVLGGGLPRGALVLVAGPPGAGKTILSGQIAFSAAHRGHGVLYLSALSEPTTKLVTHLRGYEFFREDLLGSAVRLLSLQDALDRGLTEVQGVILDEVRRARVDILVIDGLRSLRGLQDEAAREFLYDIGTILGLQGVTTIITSELDPRNAAAYPETTTADVVVALYFQLAGVRQRRGLEAVKMRGAAPLPGRHGLVLGPSGAAVYPRLEARVVDASSQSGPLVTLGAGALAAAATGRARHGPSVAERAAFGLAELDTLLGGGVNRQTSTILAGDLGAGKTLLALHFALAGIQAGEAVLYLGFRETAEQLQQKAHAFNLGAVWQAALAFDGGLTFLRWEPVELDPDLVADQILSALDRTGATRVVIDSIAELERAVQEATGPQRVANYMTGLLAILRARGATMLGIRETPLVSALALDLAAEQVSVLAENVLYMQQVKHRGELRRVLSVAKMRFSAYDPTLREYRIAPPEGIRVLGRFETGLDVLLGIAEQQGGLIAGVSGQAPAGARTITTDES